MSYPKKIKRFFGSKFPFLFNFQWNIGIVNKSIHSFLGDCKYKIKWFPLEKWELNADPFGIEKNGKIIILFENYEFWKGKAHISGFETEGDIKFDEIKTEIKEQFHLSYPFVFKYKNGIFCIPETLQKNELRVYKRNENGRWVFFKSLIKDVKAVDPTIFKYNKLWWLFFTDGKEANNRLFIYYAKNPFGNWKAHKKNPVKTVKKSSRPGGTPFIHENKLYRPAQDCSETYGGRIAINRIDELSPKKFDEKTIKFIEPFDPFSDGIHTLSSLGDRVLIDGKRLIFKPVILFSKMKRAFLIKLLSIVTRREKVSLDS